ncbi:nuclear factor 7, ovary-like [Manihot esculenta]|uniref:nuclear factor 7, ovary-like n=1 Tax=Manihot esculenta TaxID=3983 RepID=UPI001CC82091|nr:nuclear factor 7, ovary-like [Manihot esculenta]
MVSDEPKRSPSEQRQSDPVETGQTLRFKHKKRSDLHFKNTHIRQFKKKTQSPILISVPAISLEEEELPEKQENHQKEKTEIVAKEERKTEGDELKKDDSGVSCSNSVFPCMDKLREELSCAICLEICFEPSTTSCGHR